MGIIGSLLPLKFLNPILNPLIKSLVKKLQNKVFLKGKVLANLIVDRGINALGKKYFKNDFSCELIMLTNNETKDIIKVIRSLENIRISLKGTTKKLLVKKGVS